MGSKRHAQRERAQLVAAGADYRAGYMDGAQAAGDSLFDRWAERTLARAIAAREFTAWIAALAAWVEGKGEPGRPPAWPAGDVDEGAP